MLVLRWRLSVGHVQAGNLPSKVPKLPRDSCHPETKWHQHTLHVSLSYHQRKVKISFEMPHHIATINWCKLLSRWNSLQALKKQNLFRLISILRSVIRNRAIILICQICRWLTIFCFTNVIIFRYFSTHRYLTVLVLLTSITLFLLSIYGGTKVWKHLIKPRCGKHAVSPANSITKIQPGHQAITMQSLQVNGRTANELPTPNSYEATYNRYVWQQILRTGVLSTSAFRN